MMGTCHYAPDGWCDDPKCVEDCKKKRPAASPVSSKNESRLLAALQRYGTHADYCAMYKGPIEDGCNCGLFEAMGLAPDGKPLSGDGSQVETTAQPLYPQIILDRLRQIANLIDSRPVMGHWPAMMTQPDADFLRSLADALKERKTHPLLAESSEETAAPETKIEPFVVKHYTSDERPTIKGNGFDGLEIGEDREEAQAFIDWVNARLRAPSSQETKTDPLVLCGEKGPSGFICERPDGHPGRHFDGERRWPSPEKASEQECRSAGPSGNAAGTGPVDPGAEARSSRREVTAQNASVNPYCLQDGVPCASDGRGGCLACVDEKGTLNGKGDV